MKPLTSPTQKDELPTQDPNDRISTAIGYSVAFHVVLFVAFAVRAVFFPSEPLMLENAIRVDMVALPDKATAKLPPMEESQPKAAEPPKAEPPKPEPPQPVAKPELPKPPAAPAKPEPKPETPTVNLNKTKQDQEAALKRLQALQRLEKLNQKQPSAPAASTSTASAPTQVSAPVKGNEISTGSSLKGIVRLEHRSYLQTVDGHIKRHWNLPQWMANANLSAKVRLYIDASGYVARKELVRSSSNPDYDDRVMRAIESASPMPRPPENLANLLSVEGMELEFVPN